MTSPAPERHEPYWYGKLERQNSVPEEVDRVDDSDDITVGGTPAAVGRVAVGVAGPGTWSSASP